MAKTRSKTIPIVSPDSPSLNYQSKLQHRTESKLRVSLEHEISRIMKLITHLNGDTDVFLEPFEKDAISMALIDTVIGWRQS